MCADEPERFDSGLRNPGEPSLGASAKMASRARATSGGIVNDKHADGRAGRALLAHAMARGKTTSREHHRGWPGKGRGLEDFGNRHVPRNHAYFVFSVPEERWRNRVRADRHRFFYPRFRDSGRMIQRLPFRIRSRPGYEPETIGVASRTVRFALHMYTRSPGKGTRKAFHFRASVLKDANQVPSREEPALLAFLVNKGEHPAALR